MRRDQYPAHSHLSGSGLPVPRKGSRRISVINNPAMNGGVCCLGKVIFGGYIPF